jgi:hypothetical protein
MCKALPVITEYMDLDVNVVFAETGELRLDREGVIRTINVDGRCPRGRAPAAS